MINLQLFSVQVTTQDSLAAENKTFYDKNLIREASANLVHDQFGQKRHIPKNGGKTIDFRRFAPLAKATSALTEGTTPSGNSLDVTSLTATVGQYGDFITMSDVLELTAIDPIIVEATNVLGQQAGATLDTIVRNVIVGGTNVSYASKIVSGAKTAVASRSGLDTTALLTVDDIEKAVAKLRAQNAPTIDGAYVGIIHPYVAYDLMKDQDWRNPHAYASPEQLFKGEIGMIGGVRFVQTSEAKIWRDSTCPEQAGATPAYYAVFATMILGANAYGVTDVEGGGLEVIIKPKGSAGTADPLDQRSSVGWKALKTAKRLVENYMVRLESMSSFSASATAN